MKILGHPIHLMLIHFPSALFPMEFVCYFLNYFYTEEAFLYAAYYAMAGGVMGGWAAVLFGVVDLVKIPPEKKSAVQKAMFHASINMSVLTVYSVFAIILYKSYPKLPPAVVSLLIAKSILLIFMIGANYIGADLVLKDKIGIEN